MVLNPIQLQAISDEYYTKKFVLGRDKLYQHMKDNYPQFVGTINNFDSRDDIGDWLKFQPVNTIHAKQRKPRNIDHFKPRKPFHSISVDLIDYSKNGSSYTDPSTNVTHVYYYILVVIDNYSRYMWAFPLRRKTSAETLAKFTTWYNTHYLTYYAPQPAPQIRFIQMDNGGEFVGIANFCQNLPNPIPVVHSIPNVPQSNALVERSIGTLKRILAKLIHIRHQSIIAITNTNIVGIPANLNNPILWQQWHMDLDRAVTNYNNIKHSSFGRKPADAINLNIVNLAAYNAGLKQNNNVVPDQHDLNLNSYVRLIRIKGKLGKYDKLNWSSTVYIITDRRHVGNPNRRTKYQITEAHPNQAANPMLTVGNPLNHWYYKEHLQEIYLI